VDIEDGGERWGKGRKAGKAIALGKYI